MTSERKKRDAIHDQSVPEPKLIQITSIHEHIHFYQVNRLQTIKFEEQINDHIDLSTDSIEMPSEFIPSFHLNQFEEFEYEKLVDEVIYVHKVCKFDDDLMCLDELFRDNLIAHTPSFEHIDQNCEDACINNELLFLDELFKNECKKTDMCRGS